MDSLTIAQKAAKLAYAKKGTEIVLMDMKEVSALCDYFVMVSAKTRIQTKAIAREIDVNMKAMGLTKKRVSGFQHGAWILMDYGSVLVHIFIEAERKYYDLEGFWKDAPVHYFKDEELETADSP